MTIIDQTNANNAATTPLIINTAISKARVLLRQDKAVTSVATLTTNNCNAPTDCRPPLPDRCSLQRRLHQPPSHPSEFNGQLSANRWARQLEPIKQVPVVGFPRKLCRTSLRGKRPINMLPSFYSVTSSSLSRKSLLLPDSLTNSFKLGVTSIPNLSPVAESWVAIRCLLPRGTTSAIFTAAKPRQL